MFRAGMALLEKLRMAIQPRFQNRFTQKRPLSNCNRARARCKSFYEDKEGTYYLKAGDQPYAVSRALLVYL